jgi:hypothetical protein
LPVRNRSMGPGPGVDNGTPASRAAGLIFPSPPLCV